MRLICLVLAPLFFLAAPFARAHEYIVRSEAVVGNEIRLIVETMQVTSGFIVGHSSSASQAKTWLVVIPIHSSLAEDTLSRPYVIGPLWEVDAKRSAMSGQEHINFTDADRKASQAEPFVGFGHDGEPLRIQSSNNDEPGKISRLVWTRESAYWVPVGSYSAPEGVGRFNRMQIGSEPLTLAWPEHAKPILFETMTGKIVDDPWLTATFQACGGSKWIDYAVYGFLSITDDRKYIVMFPSNYLNSDGSKWVYTETGTWPKRKAPATYYQRDSVTERRFEQNHVAHGIPWDSGPVYVVTIDGELQILCWTPDFLYLEPAGEGKSIKVANPGLTWNNQTSHKTHHQSSQRRIFFFDESFDAKGEKHFAVVEWDYGANTAFKKLIDLDTILHIKWGAPSPQDRVRIDSP